MSTELSYALSTYSGDIASIHVPIESLNVPKKWRVGCVYMRPAGWLRRYTAAHVPLSDDARKWHEFGLSMIADDEYATAEFRTRKRKWPQALYDEAVEAARDAAALLLLYKRARHPRAPIGIQDFGVAGDLGAGSISSVVTLGRRIVGTYGRRRGNLATWAFSRDDVDAYSLDARFSYLDECIRIPSSQRDTMQSRFALALRTAALGVTTMHAPMQTANLATTLEVLLGSDLADSGGGSVSPTRSNAMKRGLAGDNVGLSQQPAPGGPGHVVRRFGSISQAARCSRPR